MIKRLELGEIESFHVRMSSDSLQKKSWLTRMRFQIIGIMPLITWKTRPGHHCRNEDNATFYKHINAKALAVGITQISLL